MNPQGPLSTNTPDAKAIPAKRDQMQSRVLVLAGVPILCGVGWRALQYSLAAGPAGRFSLVSAIAVSSIFGLAAWQLRAATPAAAASGALICFNTTILSSRPGSGSVISSALIPLVLLFVLTHAATRFRPERKRRIASFHEEKHGRDAAQVMANLGVAGFACLQSYWIIPGIHPLPSESVAFPLLQIPMLSALAEATADTVSSEIGQALGGAPFLLTSGRRVAPGTDGAISTIGTMAGIAGAAAIALIAVPAIGIGIAGVGSIVLAATAGLFFDSLLGATVERRGWMGNNLVNFASTLFSAGLAYLIQRAMFR